VTEAPRTEPRTFADIDEVLDVLRGHGHRVSAPCRTVLQALFAADGPLPAQAIADAERVELASVYRNLERMEALGVVKHVHLGHGPGLYMLVGAGEREFLTCERCHRVVSVLPEELDGVRDGIRREFGFEARWSHFPIVGLCPDCARG
jgi:Fur family transcriptional regulator, ferric uptake regulator